MHKNTDDISLNNNFNDDILNTEKKRQKKKNTLEMVSICLHRFILQITVKIFVFIVDLTAIIKLTAQN